MTLSDYQDLLLEFTNSDLKRMNEENPGSLGHDMILREREQFREDYENSDKPEWARQIIQRWEK